MEIKNGYTFETNVYNILTVVFLTGNQFGLLGCGNHAEGPNLTAPLFKHNKNGQWMFTKVELQKLLKEWKAKRVNVKLDQILVGR